MRRSKIERGRLSQGLLLWVYMRRSKIGWGRLSQGLLVVGVYEGALNAILQVDRVTEEINMILILMCFVKIPILVLNTITRALMPVQGSSRKVFV